MLHHGNLQCDELGQGFFQNLPGPALIHINHDVRVGASLADGAEFRERSVGVEFHFQFGEITVFHGALNHLLGTTNTNRGDGGELVGSQAEQVPDPDTLLFTLQIPHRTVQSVSGASGGKKLLDIGPRCAVFDRGLHALELGDHAVLGVA